jgi:hypothetical protein
MELPKGYRWATAEETECHLNVEEIPNARWIERELGTDLAVTLYLEPVAWWE